MTSRWMRIRYEWTVLKSPNLGFVPLALLLLGLTHGVLELASRWDRHFIENMESFFPLAIALTTVPLGIIDREAGVLEHEMTLPMAAIAGWRLAILWTVLWAEILIGVGIFDKLWGPVPFWAGVGAALGPALWLSALGLWATLIVPRVAFGYLVILALPVTDLILRVLGAFSAIPALQLIDLFAYRWNIPSVPWEWVKTAMGVVGWVGLTMAVRWRRRWVERAFR